MNVIFLDFDGVIDTIHLKTDEEVEKKVKILADICKEFDCKVVIEASCKDAFDFETGEIDGEWPNFVYNCFKKYGIECIGRTPTISKRTSPVSYIEIWKEYEIMAYLKEHPEIKHYVVIDDNEGKDLGLVEDHLIKPLYYSEDNPEEEGLLEKHKDEVKQKLLLPREKRTH